MLKIQSSEPLRLEVSLPPGLAEVVERALESGEFVDAAEFVRYLVRGHQTAARDRERVDRMLLAESAVPLELEP